VEGEYCKFVDADHIETMIIELMVDGVAGSLVVNHQLDDSCLSADCICHRHSRK